MGYKIAFDPSVNHIGVCVFRDGKLIKATTLNRPKRTGKDETLQYRWVKDVVTDFLSNYFDDDIDAICVEDFVKGYHTGQSQRKCDGARAIIIAWAWDYAAGVVSISKGTAPKEEAEMLAKHAGLECDEHAADAYHLGLLAGFDR